MNFNERAKEFSKKIEDLTLKIMDKISNDQLSEVGILIIQRLDCLTELVSSVTTERDKAWLLSYLDAFQKSDQVIIQAVNKERDVVKHTLLNIEKIKAYSTTA